MSAAEGPIRLTWDVSAAADFGDAAVPHDLVPCLQVNEPFISVRAVSMELVSRALFGAHSLAVCINSDLSGGRAPVYMSHLVDPLPEFRQIPTRAVAPFQRASANRTKFYSEPFFMILV